LFWDKSTAGWCLISQTNGAGGLSLPRHPTACSFGWWLMAGASLFWEKSTAGWLLVAGLFWDKSTTGRWLISQANRLLICAKRSIFQKLSDQRQCKSHIFFKKKITQLSEHQSWGFILFQITK
jgi:hypothetical protein